MFSNLFEFFFCPVHGIFRADNLMYIPILVSGVVVVIKGYWGRIVTKIRSWK